MSDTTVIRCIDCKRFSLKRVLPHDAKKGEGHCDLRAPFIRHRAMIERDCENHQREAIEVTRARIDWINKQREVA